MDSSAMLPMNVCGAAAIITSIPDALRSSRASFDLYIRTTIAMVSSAVNGFLGFLRLRPNSDDFARVRTEQPKQAKQPKRC